MTQQELDALKALADAATPGPWEEVAESGEWWITGPDIERGFVIDTTNGAKQETIDFIAAARAAVPALVAEVERLRADNAQLRQQLQRAGLHYTPPHLSAIASSPPFGE